MLLLLEDMDVSEDVATVVEVVFPESEMMKIIMKM